MIIFRVTPPFTGTNMTSNESSTYVEESFEESSESQDSELVSSFHELGDSSSSTAVTKVAACVGENSINQLSLAST